MSADPLRPHPDVVYELVRGEAVLVDLRTNRIYALNESGARVWELLSEGSRRDEIVARITAEFDAPQGDVEAEVDKLLAKLVAEKLVGDHGQGA